LKSALVLLLLPPRTGDQARTELLRNAATTLFPGISPRRRAGLVAGGDHDALDLLTAMPVPLSVRPDRIPRKCVTLQCSAERGQGFQLSLIRFLLECHAPVLERTTPTGHVVSGEVTGL